MASNNSSSSADRDLLREQTMQQRRARTQLTESQDAPPVAVFFGVPIKVSSSSDDPLKTKIQRTLGKFDAVRETIASGANQLIGIGPLLSKPRDPSSTHGAGTSQPHHTSYQQHRHHQQQQQQHPPPPAFADSHKPSKPAKPPYSNGHHKSSDRDRDRDRERSRSGTPSGGAVPGAGSSSSGSYRGGSSRHHGRQSSDPSSTSSAAAAAAAAVSGKLSSKTLSSGHSRDAAAGSLSQQQQPPPTSFSSASTSSNKSSTSSFSVAQDHVRVSEPRLSTPPAAAGNSLLGAPPAHLLAAGSRVSPRPDLDSRFFAQVQSANEREREQRLKASAGSSQSRLHPSPSAAASAKSSVAPPNGSFGGSSVFSRSSASTSSSSGLMAAVLAASKHGSSNSAKFPEDNQTKSKKDSVDRSEVETIFQEMIFAPTPLSAIPTPKKEESKFSFPKMGSRAEASSTVTITQPPPLTPPAPSLGKSSSTSSAITAPASIAASSTLVASSSSGPVRNLDLSACATLTDAQTAPRAPGAPPASAGIILNDLELSDSDDEIAAMTNKLPAGIDDCIGSPGGRSSPGQPPPEAVNPLSPPEPVNPLSPVSESTSSESDDSSSGSDSEEEEEEEGNGNKSPSEASEDECPPESAKPEANWSLDHFIKDTSSLTVPFGLPDSSCPAVVSPGDAASRSSIPATVSASSSAVAVPPPTSGSSNENNNNNNRSKGRGSGANDWAARQDETDEELCSMELVDDDDENDEFAHGDLGPHLPSPPPAPLESFEQPTRGADPDTFRRLMASPRVTSPLSPAPPSPLPPPAPVVHSPPPLVVKSTPILTKAAKKSLPEHDATVKPAPDKPTPAVKRKGEPTGKPRGRPPKDPHRDKTQPAAPKNGMIAKSKGRPSSAVSPSRDSSAASKSGSRPSTGPKKGSSKLSDRSGTNSSHKTSDKSEAVTATITTTTTAPTQTKSKPSEKGKVGRPKGLKNSDKLHSDKSSKRSKEQTAALSSFSASKRPPSPPGSPPPPTTTTSGTSKSRQHSVPDRARKNSTGRSHSSSSTSSRVSNAARSNRSPSPRRQAEKSTSGATTASSSHHHHQSSSSVASAAAAAAASQKLKGELVYKSKEYLSTTDSDSDIEVDNKSSPPASPVFAESKSAGARSPPTSSKAAASIAATIAAVLAGAGKSSGGSARAITPPPPTPLVTNTSSSQKRAPGEHHRPITSSKTHSSAKKQRRRSVGGSCSSLASNTSEADSAHREAKRSAGRRSRRTSDQETDEQQQRKSAVAPLCGDERTKLGSRGSLVRGILSLMVSIDLAMLDRVPPYPPLTRVKSDSASLSSKSKDSGENGGKKSSSTTTTKRPPRETKNIEPDGRKTTTAQPRPPLISVTAVPDSKCEQNIRDSKCPSVVPGRSGDNATNSKSMAPPPPATNRVPPPPLLPPTIPPSVVPPSSTSDSVGRQHKRQSQPDASTATSRKPDKKLKTSSASLTSASKHLGGSTGSVSSLASTASSSSLSSSVSNVAATKSISKTKPSSQSTELSAKREDRTDKSGARQESASGKVKVGSTGYRLDDAKIGVGAASSSSKKERKTLDAHRDSPAPVTQSDAAGVKVKKEKVSSAGNHHHHRDNKDAPPTREDPIVEVESERCRTSKDGGVVQSAGKSRDQLPVGIKKEAGVGSASSGSLTVSALTGTASAAASLAGSSSSLAAPKDRSKRQSRERDCSGGRELDAKRIKCELAVPAASTSVEQSSTSVSSSSHSTVSSYCELPKGVGEGIGRNTNHDRIPPGVGPTLTGGSKTIFGHKDWKAQLDKINEELKISQSDHFLRIAKNRRRDADKEPHGSTQCHKYLRSIAYFVMACVKKEMEHGTEKQVFDMYKDTLDLMKFISQKIRGFQSSSQQNTSLDSKLSVFSLFCQSIVYLKLYSLKKNVVYDCQRTINDYQKTPAGRATTSMAYQQPSPVNGLLGPAPPSSSLWSAKSTGTPPPMSPLPSPAGSVGSVESQSSGYSSSEIGSQSKMCGIGGGGMSVSSGVSNPSTITVATLHHTQFLSVPVHIHSSMQKQIDYLTYLSTSHEMWDHAINLITRGHTQEFFTSLDQVCGRLTLHSSPKELVRYLMMGLHVLHGDN